MYLLTEWEGRRGKYLARGEGVRYGKRWKRNNISGTSRKLDLPDHKLTKICNLVPRAFSLPFERGC